MKKISIVSVLVICLISVCVLSACGGGYRYTPLDVTVRFLTNVAGETVQLSSGRTAIAEDTVFDFQELKLGDKVTKPAENPTRVGYRFFGWSVLKETEKTEDLYDFDAAVSGSLNLYAQWVRDDGTSATTGRSDYMEPKDAYRQMIEAKKVDSSTVGLSLTGVCNQDIKKDGDSEIVNLTTVGINRLKNHKDNVEEYLNYTRAPSTEIKSATYDLTSMEVTVTYVSGGTEKIEKVKVVDVTATPDYVFTDEAAAPDIYESTFETKAQKYEAEEDFGSHNVIMAGSSSMENWSTSVLDMDPVTTKNVGIGGSSSEHWLRALADRLIIPYSPRAVVLYVGINDIINFGKGGYEAADKITDLFLHIHKHLPDTTIHYILINHVPKYYQGANKAAIDFVNEAVTGFAENHSDYMNIIDAGEVLEKKSGKYSEAYFLSDGLHMTIAGYRLWGPVVKESVIAKDKELEKELSK